MSKLREVMGWVNVVIVGVIVALVMWSLVGCAHEPPHGTKLIKRACESPTIVTYTLEDWSDTDQRAYDTAQRRCQELYPRSPCVRKFIRYAQTRYGVICGASLDNELEVMVTP